MPGHRGAKINEWALALGHKDFGVEQSRQIEPIQSKDSIVNGWSMHVGNESTEETDV